MSCRPQSFFFLSNFFHRSFINLTRYILFYKPYDVLCQFTDNSDTPRQTLKDYIDVPLVYPAGRLDRDSEGLLLLTNNGRLKHRLLDPQFGKRRTYWVQVERIPNDEALQQLSEGVTVRQYQTRPAEVRRLPTDPDLPPRNPPIRFRKNVPTCWLEMTLTEGRNRQVRRMTAAVGHPTLRLVRVSIENLRLGSLQPGQWRDLSEAEIAVLYNRCGFVRRSVPSHRSKSCKF
ncbi:MAG: pseudouridine synthase [Cyanobacteria bacterium SID2]|nr:pseudouridine synthase [Cyanobacteria bacterium SID2]MBP0004152.1 pseudouridine synthase [Cyanobacteria bacterium SBC]